jgi:hypothetical protein
VGGCVGSWGSESSELADMPVVDPTGSAWWCVGGSPEGEADGPDALLAAIIRCCCRQEQQRPQRTRARQASEPPPSLPCPVVGVGVWVCAFDRVSAKRVNRLRLPVELLAERARQT